MSTKTLFIRIDEELHDQIKQDAQESGVAMTTYLRLLLKQNVGGKIILQPKSEVLAK